MFFFQNEVRSTTRGAGHSVETVEIDSERSIHAVTAGEGADIVLLHGAMTTHRDWLDGPFQSLAKLGRVTALDRPGHGLSRRPRFAASPRTQAAQIREGLKALGVSRPILVAHSFGCLCALAYAEQYPGEVSHLILVAPLAFPELRPFEHGFFAPRAVPVLGPALSTMTPRFVDRAVLEMIHGIMFSPDSPSDSWKANYPWEQILEPDSILANAEDSAAVHPLSLASRLELGPVETPALILNGTADLVVSEALQAGRLQSVLPNSEQIRLEGAGHMAHHTRSDAVIDAVREALEKVSAYA
ncbi:MAG: alpha/beta fold hydrolase [Allosphingosinicella sp.]